MLVQARQSCSQANLIESVPTAPPVEAVKAIEYKPYTPPPVVEAPKGDYLDDLSRNGNGMATSGTVIGQSNYLDALISQNVEPSGTGMGGYLDDVGLAEPARDVVSEVVPVPTTAATVPALDEETDVDLSDED